MSERARVLYVIGSLRRGGAEGQLVALATGLDRARYEPSLLLLKPLNDFAEELARAGVAVSVLQRSGAWDPRLAWRVAAHVRRLRPRVVHGFLSFANLVAALATRLAPVPRLVLSQRASYQHELGPLWRRVARWSHGLADAVIVNSPVTLREELAAGCPPDRLHYVPNGVAEPSVTAPLPDGLPVGPRVVCVARLTWEKGHARLLEAWPALRRRHAQAQLILVGDGPLRADLAAQAARLGIADSVHLLGARAPVTPYLQAADVFVLASLTEGAPNAVLEAMACARPVVATRVGGVPELVAEGETGLLVPAGDAAAMADALSLLLADTARRETLGQAGQRRARERFSMAAMVRATEHVYEAQGAP